MEKSEFAYLFKSFVRVLSDFGCLAFTGSSMVTFLNCMREQKTNGFEMFNTAEYVLLGHNLPSKQWERHIVTEIMDGMKMNTGSDWTKVFGPYLTPELVLETLRSKPDFFTVRPALIHQLLENLQGTDSNSSIDVRLVESAASVLSKLHKE